MSPDEALADVRLLCAKDTAEGIDPHEVERLVGLVKDLDRWCSGGALPKDWTPAVRIRSIRETRQYMTKSGHPVQVALLPDGVAVVTWQAGTREAWTSRETESWLDAEVKNGWLIPMSITLSAEPTETTTKTQEAGIDGGQRV